MKRTGKDGFTFVEVLAALALLAVLIVISWGKFNKSYENALEATLLTDLRNLATAQEIYYREHVTYTTDLAALRISPSPKSQITISAADARGWAAWNRIDQPPKQCEVYVGKAHSAPLGFATSSERITCGTP